MPNEQNLMPIEEVNSRRTREQHSADSSKGGKKSAAVRKEKADLRKMAQSILDGTFKDKHGKEITGKEIVIQGLLSNLSNGNNRNWGKAMDILIQLTGANITELQKAKTEAETKLAEAKVKQIEEGGNVINVEDLSSLAEMLKDDEDTDNTVETVLE